jgi:uncharacterized damage-inducible protein DinB
MASADELRASIAEQRTALRAAIQAAGGKWTESPGGEEWSAKQIAEHAIGAEVYFANIVSKAMLGKPGEFERKETASAAEALERSEAAAAVADKVLRYVEDRDLAKPAEGIPNSDQQTVEAAMIKAREHLAEHTAELQSRV